MLKGSYRTSGLGLGMILAAIGAALTAMLDNDPNTVVDWTALGIACASGAGLLFARDNKVSS